MRTGELLARLAIGVASGCAAGGTTQNDAATIDAARRDATPDAASADAASPQDAARDAAADGAAVDSAVRDATLDAPVDAGRVCVDSLDGVATGDFLVTFRVRSTQTQEVTLLYQRSVCDHEHFWNVQLAGDGTGTVVIELDDAAGNYMSLAGVRRVNDGAWHRVSVGRTAGTVRIEVDGLVDATAPCTVSLESLPPLGTESGHPCEGLTSQVALIGSLDSICLSAN
jgi:Laminin G domain